MNNHSSFSVKILFFIQLAITSLALSSCSLDSSKRFIENQDKNNLSEPKNSEETTNLEELTNSKEIDAATPGFVQSISQNPLQGMMPPSPMPNEVVQPDGTRITLYLKGNACLHWEEDEEGYTVLQNDKRYVYAKKLANGRLVPTDFEVGKHQPSKYGLQRHLRPKPKEIIVKDVSSDTASEPCPF